MGTSTNAYVAFGVDLGEDAPWAAEWATATCDVYDDMVAYVQKHAGEAVEVRRHCSAGCPMFLLVVPGTVCAALRGTPDALDFDRMQAIAEAGRQEFMASLDKLEINAGPEWLLFSYWG